MPVATFDDLVTPAGKGVATFDDLIEQPKAETPMSDPEMVDAMLGRQESLRKPSIVSTTEGGPPVAVAPASVALAEPMEELTRPTLRFSELVPAVEPSESVPTAAAKTLGKVALGIPEFFTSKLGATTLMTGKAAPRATAGAFAVDMLRNVPSEVKSLGENWDQMTPAQKTESLVGLGATVLLGSGLGAKALAPSAKAKVTATPVVQREAVRPPPLPQEPPPLPPIDIEQPRPAVKVEDYVEPEPTETVVKAEELKPTTPSAEPLPKEVFDSSTPPEFGESIAVELKDGRVLWSDDQAHGFLAQRLNDAGIPDSEIVSSGFIDKNGKYKVGGELQREREIMGEVEERSPQAKKAAETAEPSTVSQIARDELKRRGWDEKWPFIPADLQNQSFVDAIKSDPSISASEKAKILSFAPGGKNEITLSSMMEGLQPKGEPYAIQERETKALPVEVPPGDRRAVEQEIREQTAAKETAAPESASPEARNVVLNGVEDVPATENGGRIAIIMQDGTAIVGGRIHADGWNKAVEQGIATDAQLEQGTAGFVKPDGTAWGVNGQPLPKVTKAIIVSDAKPKPPEMAKQRPPEPPAPKPKEPITEADLSVGARKAWNASKSKEDEFHGVDVTDLPLEDRRMLAEMGLSFSEDRNRRIMATYPARLRAEDLRKKVTSKQPSTVQPATPKEGVGKAESNPVQRAQAAVDTFRRLVLNPARQAAATAKGKVAKAKAVMALRDANAVDATLRELFNDKTISESELEQRVKSITGDELAKGQIPIEGKPSAVATPRPEPKQPPPAATEGGVGKGAQDRLRVRFGGSHRLYRKQVKAFQDAGIELREVGSFSLGSKARNGIIPDTPEARALAKKMGMTVAREQWTHLKAKPPPAATEGGVGKGGLVKRETVSGTGISVTEVPRADPVAFANSLFNPLSVTEKANPAERLIVQFTNRIKQELSKRFQNTDIDARTVVGEGNKIAQQAAESLKNRFNSEMDSLLESKHKDMLEKGVSEEEFQGFKKMIPWYGGMIGDLMRGAYQPTFDRTTLRASISATKLHLDMMENVVSALTKHLPKEDVVGILKKIYDIGPKTKSKQPPLAATKGGGKLEELGAALGGAPPAGGKSQIEQLADAFANKAPAKDRAQQMMRASFDYGTRIAQAKDAVSKAISGLKESGRSIWTALSKFEKPDDLLKAKGELSAALESRGWRVREFAKAVKASHPDIRRRNAIAKWIDAGGDDVRLALGEAATKPQFKQAYQDARNLTPDEKVAAQNIQNFFDSRLQEAIDAGVLETGLEDYIHRIYPKDTPTRRKALAYVQSGILSKNPGLARKRFYEFDYEAEAAGLKPTQDFLPRITDYETSLARSIAAREFVRKMTTMTAPDGRPVIGIKGVGIPVEDASGVRTGTIIKPLGDFKKATNPADPLNYRGDYVNKEYGSLSRWKWVGADTDGKPIFLQGNVAIHPDFVGRVQALLEPSHVRFGRYPRLGTGLLTASSTVKQTMLDLSGFHQVQIALHGLEHRVNPFRLVQNVDFENPNVQGLLKGGITLGGEYQASHMGEGLVGRSITQHVPGLGPILESYHEWLFQSFIPRMKLTMGLHALERNRSRYAKELASGRMTEDDLNYLTAKQANAAFGELNYIMLERSKTTQDMARLIMLAPDFLEARGRFVAQAFQKYGTEQRVALLLGALAMYAAARVANKIVDDQWHLEPENLFSLVKGNTSWNLRTVQGDVLHMLTKPLSFWLNRLNPLYSRTLLEAITQRDQFGRKRTLPQVLGDTVSTAVPISLRSSRERSMFQSLATSFGVTAKRYNDVADVRKMADEWKKKNGIREAPGEFIYDADKDPLRPLKLALSDGDEAGAVKEIKKALEGGVMTLPKLNQYFEHYSRRPFTGSVSNEHRFVASLTGDDRKTYNAAQEHKQRMASLYAEALSKYMMSKQSLFQ